MQPTQIRKLSDSELLSRLKDSVPEERRQTALVLEFLREVDRRKLYADSGHSSLWEFCTRELGYTEAAASRRIASMRLLRELPGLKEDLIEGKQSLSSLALAQHFFRSEERHQNAKLSVEEKREVLGKLENKSSRECEKELLALSSAPLEISRPERKRPIDETHLELRLVIDEELDAKLKRIQALRSHASPQMTYSDLLRFMADEVLKRLDPEEKAKLRKKPQEEAKPPTPEAVPQQSRRSKRAPLPAALRRSVWLRDHGQCGWRDPKTGKQCGSRAFLELDHIQPVALDGSNDAINLRLLCKAHNLRAAVRVFGQRGG